MRYLLLLLLTASHAYSLTYGRTDGWCEQGGQKVLTGAVNSTTSVQRSYPGCTVTVYITGSGGTPATLYSDAAGTTPLSNPFVSTSNGFYAFYTANGVYDIQLSGGGLASPVTLGATTVNYPTLRDVQICNAKGDGTTDDYAAIQSCLDSGSPVTFPPGTYLIETTLVSSSANQEIICLGGATLKSGSGIGNLLQITGNNTRIHGCKFDGDDEGANGDFLVFINANNARFYDNTFTNTVPGQFAVVARTSYSDFSHNYGSNLGGPGIALQGTSDTVSIIGNQISRLTYSNGALSGSAIEAKVGGSGGTISNLEISGNSVTTTTGFCYEAGNFSGSGLSGVVGVSISSNTCKLASTGSQSGNCSASSNAKACGGVSLSTVTNGSVSGLAYYAVGQAADIAGIELVQCVNCSAVGNSIYGDTAATVNGSNGVSANCLRCTIANNTIIDFGPVSANSGIFIYTSSTFKDISGLTVSGNSIKLPTGVAGGAGVRLSCNHAAGNASQLTLTGNTVTGPVLSSQYSGFVLAANDPTCVSSGITIVGNSFSTLFTGVLVFYMTNIEYTGNNYVNVTNKFSNNGGSTYNYSYTLSRLAVGSLSDPADMLFVNGSALVNGHTVVGSLYTPNIVIGGSFRYPYYGNDSHQSLWQTGETFIKGTYIDRLSATINDSTTTVTVYNGSGILNGYWFYVDNEVMLVTGGGGTNTLTVQRGYLSTTATSHLVDSAIGVINAVGNSPTFTFAAGDDTTPGAQWRFNLQALENGDGFVFSTSDYTSIQFKFGSIKGLELKDTGVFPRVITYSTQGAVSAGQMRYCSDCAASGTSPFTCGSGGSGAWMFDSTAGRSCPF